MLLQRRARPPNHPSAPRRESRVTLIRRRKREDTIHIRERSFRTPINQHRTHSNNRLELVRKAAAKHKARSNAPAALSQAPPRVRQNLLNNMEKERRKRRRKICTRRNLT